MPGGVAGERPMKAAPYADCAKNCQVFSRAQDESVTHGGVGDDFVLDLQIDSCRVVVLGHSERDTYRPNFQAGLLGEIGAKLLGVWLTDVLFGSFQVLIQIDSHV
jgi:hypothetical protein